MAEVELIENIFGEKGFVGVFHELEDVYFDLVFLVVVLVLEGKDLG